jgi:hypothetical protein
MTQSNDPDDVELRSEPDESEDRQTTNLDREIEKADLEEGMDDDD